MLVSVGGVAAANLPIRQAPGLVRDLWRKHPRGEDGQNEEGEKDGREQRGTALVVHRDRDVQECKTSTLYMYNSNGHFTILAARVKQGFYALPTPCLPT